MLVSPQLHSGSSSFIPAESRPRTHKQTRTYLRDIEGCRGTVMRSGKSFYNRLSMHGLFSTSEPNEESNLRPEPANFPSISQPQSYSYQLPSYKILSCISTINIPTSSGFCFTAKMPFCQATPDQLTPMNVQLP